MRGAVPEAGIARVLFLSAFVVATCGLVYELVAGALASYLLGNSITQFSLIIGAYLSAMGVGSYLSRFVERNLLARFVEIEVAIALFGGFEAMILFAAFAYTDAFRPVLFAQVGLIGMLVGLELPLLIRILEEQTNLRILVSRILFLDYIGALFASLLFPLLFLPKIGAVRTSLVFGLLNGAVALWTTFLFRAPTPVRLRLRGIALAAMALLAFGLAVAPRAELHIEQSLFADPVVLREHTPYQRLVVTHRNNDTRLFINGALQFSSRDEYRYHEALVHPAMTATHHARVLILGGGDGLGLREVLRYPEVDEVVLVDLDPAMTDMFRDRDELAALNQRALSDPRVQVVNADAFNWLQENPSIFDVVIIDFPDPNDYGLGKLYTNHFYRLVSHNMGPDGVLAVQSTSPLFSPDAYWCIITTLEAEGFDVRPYHAYVPSFGEWGFALASRGPIDSFAALPPGLKFLNAQVREGLFAFPPDLGRRSSPVNRLDNQILVHLYEQDWARMR